MPPITSAHQYTERKVRKVGGGGGVGGIVIKVNGQPERGAMFTIF